MWIELTASDPAVIPWGWASDKYGRKPVLLISLMGLVLSTTLFGFSTQVWHMFVARAISGLFGGSAVIVRTVSTLARPELCTHRSHLFLSAFRRDF
jgi:MFS family permease